MPPTNSEAIAQAVTQYAVRFTGAHPGDHGVTSPLGAWLLLALAAPLTDGAARDELEAILGLPAADAHEAATALLASPPDAVACAVAVWADAARLRPAYGEWAGGLPGTVERGAVPDQAAVDRWAAERTRGLVERFPVDLPPLTRIVLASASATRMSWTRPLEVVAAAPLGPWAAGVREALRMPGAGGRAGVCETEAAGLVGVAVPGTGDDLRVLSVVAAPEVGPADVLRAAHEVAEDPRWVEVADSGHAWTVAERREQRYSHEQLVWEWTTTLPAWHAGSDLDLMASPGVAIVGRALGALLPPEDQPAILEARQSCVAAYGREGFEAAAVTAFAARAASAPPPLREVTVREVDLRFDRPHAVVAVLPENAWGDEVPRAWRGVPVYAAWVAEPSEVS